MAVAFIISQAMSLYIYLSVVCNVCIYYKLDLLGMLSWPGCDFFLNQYTVKKTQKSIFIFFSQHSLIIIDSKSVLIVKTASKKITAKKRKAYRYLAFLHQMTKNSLNSQSCNFPYAKY